MLLRMLAYGNATKSEIGVIVDDEVEVLVLSDSDKGVDIPLHEDILFF
jgi:hypothetical protein